MLLARLLSHRSALPLSQAYHGLVLTTAQACIGRPEPWTAGDTLQPFRASLGPGTVGSALASGIPGAGGIGGGAAGSASAERSTGLPSAETGASGAAETSTGLASPSSGASSDPSIACACQLR